MSTCGHLAAFTAPPGQRPALLEILRPQLALVPDEPATLVYVFAVSNDVPDTVWSFERYTDVDGFKAHGHAPGVLEGIRAMSGLTVSVHHLDHVTAGRGFPTADLPSVMIDDEQVAAAAGAIVRYDDRTQAPGAGDAEDAAALSLWQTEAASPGTWWHYAVFATRADRDHYLALADLDGAQVWRTDIVAGKWAPTTATTGTYRT